MAAVDHTALQRAVFETLSMDEDLCAVLPDGASGVAAFMPAGSQMPYVVIEGIASQPIGMQAETLDDCEVLCAVYSDQPGGAQARSVLQKVTQAFSNLTGVEGYHLVMCQPGTMQTQLLADGLTYRAALTVRIVVEAQEV